MPSLLELNRDILDAIRNLAFDACCHDLPFQHTPDQTTDLTPHEGPAPETWGSEPVADWDDWELLVCGAAGAWVDLQVDNARIMQTLLNVGAITLAVIIGFFAVFSLTAISLGTAATIWGGIATLAGTQIFSLAADAMEENRDKIVCAIKGEYTQGLRGTMQEITPVLAWSAWYQWQAYENVEATIWEGGNPNHGDLTVYREGCPDCENILPPADYIWSFDTSNEGWGGTAVLSYPFSGSNQEMALQSGSNDQFAKSPNIRDLLDLPAGEYTVKWVRIKHRKPDTGTSDSIIVELLHQSNDAVLTADGQPNPLITTNPGAESALYTWIQDEPMKFTISHNLKLQLRVKRVSGSGGNVHFIDSIEVWVEPA
jgi:hypothetical protein